MLIAVLLVCWFQLIGAILVLGYVEYAKARKDSENRVAAVIQGIELAEDILQQQGWDESIQEWDDAVKQSVPATRTSANVHRFRRHYARWAKRGVT